MYVVTMLFPSVEQRDRRENDSAQQQYSNCTMFKTGRALAIQYRIRQKNALIPKSRKLDSLMF
jgi:hypothetical protein